MELVFGDSVETVPAYALREKEAGRDPRACGVIFVDGDHREEGMYTDLVNMQALTSRFGRGVCVLDLLSVVACFGGGVVLQ